MLQHKERTKVGSENNGKADECDKGRHGPGSVPHAPEPVKCHTAQEGGKGGGQGGPDEGAGHGRAVEAEQQVDAPVE